MNKRFVVLLGPPGAGKGTQAKRLSEELSLPHISSGEIFREHLRENSELGEQAREYMDRGDLVPDDLTISMIADRLGEPDCSRGAILDGFPRTPAQAEGLGDILSEQGTQVSVVLFIAVPEDELVRRLTGRLVCVAEGHVYHTEFNPPEREGICDIDGSELYQRDDDKPETVRARIKVYMNKTEPLIEYYRSRGLLTEVDGAQPIEGVTRDLVRAVPAGVKR